MNAVELGTHGGVAKRAFKLKGVDVKPGDSVTAEMLDGLSSRHTRALGASGLVTYYNQAGSEEAEPLAAKPEKLKKRSK